MTCTCTNPEVGFCNPHERREPEPTTAEAFATVRETLAAVARHSFPFPGGDAALERGREALALLERRMREMRDALQMVSEQGINSQWVEGGRKRDMQREVRKALDSR